MASTPACRGTSDTAMSSNIRSEPTLIGKLDVKAVQDWLGHKDIKSTMVYTQFPIEGPQRSCEADL